MLKGIPKIISPALLKVLCEMGHGDRILLADANFPVESVGKDTIVIRCDGHGIPELLEAILPLFPLDKSTDKPMGVMQVTPGEDVKTPVWDTYAEIASRCEGRGKEAMQEIERYAFYDMSRRCYAIVATGEAALYANIVLQKGVI